MRQAVIVIGSSYGDEGKGLAAVLSAKRLGGKCLNVLINGGAQRGHTVEWRDGRRHVFHHFGSAAALGAVSCADEDYIVNPLLYGEERARLKAIGLRPELTVSSKCRVSLPWDMMLGQIIEENRGKARHGSCGCGIFETVVRFRESPEALKYGELRRLSEKEFYEYARDVAGSYMPKRLNDMGMKMDDGWRAVAGREDLIRRTWMDVESMLENTRVFESWADAAGPWQALVFEAGQGLALDEGNREDFPYLTPSHTTSLIAARRIASLPGDTAAEVNYVTRTYLTRHGPGPFPSECRKEEINADMEDRTNVPNPHQERLRYGWFDARRVRKRIFGDLEASRRVLPGIKARLTVTHLNETGGKLAGADRLDEMKKGFDFITLSDSPYIPE